MAKYICFLLTKISNVDIIYSLNRIKGGSRLENSIY